MKASQHSQGRPLWEVCVLQTHFTAKGRIDNLTVRQNNGRQEEGKTKPPTRPREGGGRGTEQPLHYTGLSPSQAEEAFFHGLRGDVCTAARDLADKASVVDSVGHNQADREKRIHHTEFAAHLRGLQNMEIRSSFKVA